VHIYFYRKIYVYRNGEATLIAASAVHLKWYRKRGGNVWVSI